jgi:hypothetical protein
MQETIPEWKKGSVVLTEDPSLEEERLSAKLKEKLNIKLEIKPEKSELLKKVTGNETLKNIQEIH